MLELELEQEELTLIFIEMPEEELVVSAFELIVFVVESRFCCFK